MCVDTYWKIWGTRQEFILLQMYWTHIHRISLTYFKTNTIAYMKTLIQKKTDTQYTCTNLREYGAPGRKSWSRMADKRATKGVVSVLWKTQTQTWWYYRGSWSAVVFLPHTKSVSEARYQHCESLRAWGETKIIHFWDYNFRCSHWARKRIILLVMIGYRLVLA